MTSLGNGQEGDFVRIHLLTITHKTMCYISIHVFKTEMPISNMEHNIKDL